MKALCVFQLGNGVWYRCGKLLHKIGQLKIVLTSRVNDYCKAGL